ncbi:hypothetical protein F4680DRAFT_465739 [Xylaria scruposa]|nr:hypothetical protein F4680DRAFT_465739 [Xylaria scruposa]
MAQERPLSPWANRFGEGRGESEPFMDDVVDHSGIAPKLPSLDPKYYADKPPHDNSARTASELDHLFASEALQFRYFRGCYSWMVGPLMRYVRFSKTTGLISGGHRAADNDPVDPNEAPTKGTQHDLALRIFRSERIQVDESKWFGFLKKDRWLDWQKSQPFLKGRNWSVDHPKVWEVLSISIELLDRVLKALVADKHEILETVLYGVDMPWDRLTKSPPPFKDAHFLCSMEFTRKLCNDRKWTFRYEFVAQFTPEDYTTRLEHLLNDLIWSFIDKYQFQEKTWGVTLGELIAIDVGDIKNLMGGGITIAERCLIHFNLMGTMLHELFHALFQRRRDDKTWPANRPAINRVKKSSKEPFYGDDSVTEMGYAAEQRIWGGRVSIGLEYCDDLPFGAYIMDWPGPQAGKPGEDMIEDGAAFQLGRTIHITRIPALFTSRMLSAEFWDNANIPRKSDNYFHQNRLFTSDTISEGRKPLKYSEVKLYNAARTNSERQMIRAWFDRKWDWYHRRTDWYKENLLQWRRTPWSDVPARQLILKFGRAFRDKNEIECKFIARRLLMRLTYWKGRNTYIQGLPPPYNPALTPVRENHSWIFHAIGLLMLVALPIQASEIRSEYQFDVTYRFIPRRGTAERLKKTRKSHEVWPEDDRVIPPSVLHDPLGGQPMVVTKAMLFDQKKYLDVLNRLIDYLAKNGVRVSHPWLRQIMDIAEDLRRQRRDVSASGKKTWVNNWRFAIPAYDTSIARFRRGKWTKVT